MHAFPTSAWQHACTTCTLCKFRTLQLSVVHDFMGVHAKSAMKCSSAGNGRRFVPVLYAFVHGFGAKSLVDLSIDRVTLLVSYVSPDTHA